MPDHGTRSQLAARLDRLRDRLSINPMSLVLLAPVGVVGSSVLGLEILEILEIGFLFLLWPLVAPVYRAVRARVTGQEVVSPLGWVSLDGGLGALVSQPLTMVNPLVLRQDALQFLGSGLALLRHRGSLPAPEDHEQAGRYRLPVDGTWTVVNGSPVEAHSHSWYPATQRYAYDLVRTDAEGRTAAPEEAGLDAYHCYEEPVLAPAAGVVVAVGEGDVELDRGGGLSHPLKRSVTGNYVTIRHAEGEYCTLAHLVPGSVTVSPGDRVARGERVGRCGHTGNSSEPHLHVQFQDHPSFELAAGLPVAFTDVDVECPGDDVTAAAGWDVDGAGTWLHVGQRVTHEPADEGDGQEAGPSTQGEPEQQPDSGPDAGSALPALDAGLSGLLVRTAHGLVVGGTTAFGVDVLLDWGPARIAALLAVGGLVGLAVRGWRRATGRVTGPRRALGLVAGVWLTAGAAGALATVPGLPAVGVGGLAGGAVLAGLCLDVGVWAWGRRGLRRALDRRQPA